ncbi:hypothetical protein MJO10_30410, partial [Salmonella enterica subsp. enterica serovar Anatum]|nr:hypothetical protein [Salmonella enterica subsp. enterica serovar Anatum]
AICCNGTYLYDYQAKTVLDADPMPVDKALQLIDLLDEHQIHGYVLTIQAEVSFRLFYFYYLALFFKHLLWIDNQRPITQHTGTV